MITQSVSEREREPALVMHILKVFVMPKIKPPRSFFRTQHNTTQHTTSHSIFVGSAQFVQMKTPINHISKWSLIWIANNFWNITSEGSLQIKTLHYCMRWEAKVYTVRYSTVQHHHHHPRARRYYTYFLYAWLGCVWFSYRNEDGNF